jgi:DNA-directed RNA polymerase alpha subunit
MKLTEIGKEAQAAIRNAVVEKHPVSNLEQLGVSQRLINLLQTNGINHMGDLLENRRESLMKLQNFGEKQMQVLFDALSKYHLVED